jgi:hypothetical protein
MPRPALVNRHEHGNKKWQPVQSYGYVAKEALAPIVVAELAKAALAMPLAFTEQSGRYSLKAVLSLVPGRNMFVAPDGRWLASHIPAAFSSYPFTLVAKPDSEAMLLFVDEDSGLVTDGPAGESFFDAEGNATTFTKSVMDFLADVRRSQAMTDLSVEMLAQAGVIAPWTIKVKTGQGEQKIEGLHRIDEAALSALPDEAFLKLRSTAALQIAHAQLISMGQISLFEKLAQFHVQAAPAPISSLPDSADKLFDRSESGGLKFD